MRQYLLLRLLPIPLPIQPVRQKMMRYVWTVCFVLSLASASWAEDSIPAIRRILPPLGMEIDAKTKTELTTRLEQLQKQLETVENNPLSIDAEIYLKAVSLALRNGEFYKPKDVNVARAALDSAEQRIAQIDAGKPEWTTADGLLVRGYRSTIDDSPQPYGLHIPADLDLSKPVPLYVWLHGRGDKETDLYFIHGRQRSKGYVAPDDAITLHPFGRQCIGFKSAGEIDILDAIEDVKQRYAIDPDRIVLMGFSMGGAGVWHVGAHYADHWVAMSPGAGFAETARYQKLKPENYPPSYTQKLWGCYDVPDYVRNLFNLPVIAYSGEIDKQIQAAQVMEAAYAAEGRTLPHLIGPQTAHKYEPETLKVLLAKMKEFRDAGLNRTPTEVSLQTQTLRYRHMHWVEALRLEEHWRDSRIDAQVAWPDSVTLTTKNIAALALHLQKIPTGFVVEIDGQKLNVETAPADDAPLSLVKQDGEWTFAAPAADAEQLAKLPGLQGPIDDVFLEPFMVVVPREKSTNARLQQWLEFEIAHFDDRWQALFRGKPRWKYDDQVTPADIAKYHLIAWGTPQTNRLIRDSLEKLPLTWDEKQVTLGGRQFSADVHVPLMIYPNPLNPQKYLVLNSGPTFREADDSSNSRQNPQLPDWAIIDITTPPNGSTPGKVAAADFFDEVWQVKPTKEAE